MIVLCTWYVAADKMSGHLALTYTIIVQLVVVEKTSVIPNTCIIK